MKKGTYFFFGTQIICLINKAGFKKKFENLYTGSKMIVRITNLTIGIKTK